MEKDTRTYAANGLGSDSPVGLGQYKHGSVSNKTEVSEL